jgi:enterochelin esterase-like enzyme
MSLTGTSFFALAVILVLAVPAVMVLTWNRVPGPGPVRIAARVGMTVLSQAAAVLVVLVWVNNSYGLYDNWGDLLGSGNTQVHMDSGSHLSATGALGSGGEGSVRPLTFANFKPDVLTATATGARSHITGDIYVWLPPQYNQAAYRHTRFPVVELLPGYPGTPRAWFTAMDAQQELASLITAHKAKPMILVAAKMNVLGHNDPGCANIPGGSQTATWLGQDVPGLVKKDFRADTAAKDWAVMGYSAGAYCAVNLTVHYPRTFHSAVSLSGYNAPLASLVTHHPALARANNPYLVLRSEKHQPDIALLMAGSGQDGGTVYAARMMLGVLHHQGTSQLLTLTRGGHNFKVWREMLPASLSWISAEAK